MKGRTSIRSVHGRQLSRLPAWIIRPTGLMPRMAVERLDRQVVDDGVAEGGPDPRGVEVPRALRRPARTSSTACGEPLREISVNPSGRPTLSKAASAPSIVSSLYGTSPSRRSNCSSRRSVTSSPPEATSVRLHHVGIGRVVGDVDAATTERVEQPGHLLGVVGSVRPADDGDSRAGGEAFAEPLRHAHAVVEVGVQHGAVHRESTGART